MDTNVKIVIAASAVSFFVGFCYGVGVANDPKNTTSTSTFPGARKKDRDTKIVLDAMLEQMSAEQQAAAWRVVHTRTNFADIVNRL